MLLESRIEFDSIIDASPRLNDNEHPVVCVSSEDSDVDATDCPDLSVVAPLAKPAETVCLSDDSDL